ncbi:MAG: amidohydrolase family protein [Bacteroidetes bacterium]|nr:amidohydrolase family protein [Bacteroidota bacterium]
MPDMYMLHDQNCQLTVGTDSLASNDTLSILEELKVLHINFPKIAIKDLLTFATRNGAQYFGWDDLGTFTKKAKPGIINITHSNSETIEAKSEAIRVI